ncbi:MAG: AAA family ATPase [Hyphomicrobiaceae bacterium]
MNDQTSESQREIFEFLREPSSWQALGPRPDRVDVIETHGALVFLAGSEVLKVKRAVKLAYLDFSTLDRRRAVCQRELALNHPAAPDIYKEVLAIVRRADGRLALGGPGTPVEWAVRMVRFGQDQLLESVATRSGIGVDLAKALADMAAASHARAPVAVGIDTAPRLEAVVATIVASLAAVGQADAMELGGALERRVAAGRTLLAQRAAAGLVRRCHGDLHLGNIVMWNGMPAPFDAIEFDEDLATVDTLYDLAFLLMDLDRHGCRPAANVVLARYLWRTGRDLDLEGLALLPVFLALRAGVRAMVRADRARQVDGRAKVEALARVAHTTALAHAYLAPPAPRLIVVGGLSGTGKSTLAAALAPAIGAAPGSLHLRSDLERKALAGVDEAVRLPPSHYTAGSSAGVYEALVRKANLALRAGHSVILDAVFATPQERARCAALADACGAAFTGIWLEAGSETLKARVAARRGDASDATVTTVESQLGYELGSIDWVRVDASRGPDVTRAAAERLLGRLTPAPPPGP